MCNKLWGSAETDDLSLNICYTFITMIKAIILFAVGLVLLIKGGDWFVDGAVGIAHKFRLPEILIGATIVSIGTTLPEVMVSSGAALSGHGQIAYGNAIGSIICNTSLIAALTMAIRPSSVDKKSLKTPVLFFFGAAVLYAFTAYVIKSYTRVVGIILLLVFAVYMILTVRQAFKNPVAEDDKKEEIEDEKPLWKNVLLLVIGAAAIAFGARLLVNNGTIIAEELGVPESVIGLTIVALGTSLPEFVTAIVSLIKGHSSLSVGNIIGANLFNLVLVSGMSITLSPFDLPAEKLVGGLNASLVIDIPLMFAVMLIMTVPPLVKGKLSRTQGIVLLALYAAFCVFQFGF